MDYLKRRILTLVTLTALVLTIGSQAAELRGIAAKPRISFSNATSLLDQRRTYSITVSGTFRIASATFANKLASADFYCGTTGVVS